MYGRAETSDYVKTFFELYTDILFDDEVDYNYNSGILCKYEFIIF